MNSITDSMLRRRPWSVYPLINSLVPSSSIYVPDHYPETQEEETLLSSRVKAVETIKNEEKNASCISAHRSIFFLLRSELWFNLPLGNTCRCDLRNAGRSIPCSSIRRVRRFKLLVFGKCRLVCL